MVSLWPWRGVDNSPASFEKTLSTLSGKITESQSRLDRLRSSSRRFRVLWTLYLGFAYVVYVILLLVVVGYQNLGAYEWAGAAGGPVFIIAGRKLAGSYYNFRIESLTARLKDSQSERAKTIQKLKDATKYDSTLELIEKYGGEQKKEKVAPKHGGKQAGQKQDANTQQQQQQQQQAGAPNRTHMPPPPTANIQNRAPSPLPNAPSPAPAKSPGPLEPGAEFAPNAYAAAASPPPPPSFAQAGNMSSGSGEPHWYDRVFDVLLGEDETAAKNRIVLLCSSCRLVNGQAPPGTTSLAEVGLWRCMACHAKNGVENEGKRIVDEVLAGSKDDVDDDEEEGGQEQDIPEVEGEVEVSATGADGPAAGVKKRRAKKGN